MRELSDRELERMFALDGAIGPARPIDDARASAIVEAALRGAGFPPSGPSGGGGGGMTAVRGGVAKWGVIAGGTIAAVMAVAWLSLRGGATMGAPVVTVADVEAVPTQVAAADDAVVVPDEAAPAADEPAAPPTPARHRPHHPRGSRRHVVAAAAATEPPPTVATTAPADLLAAANTARFHHQWRAADAIYAQVIDGDARTLAAQTALVASGSLRLEHLEDPRGATVRFRAALAAGSDGALAEDARWGLAEAARALGDPAGELRALDDFLSHHGSSALAPRARERRSQLRGAP